MRNIRDKLYVATFCEKYREAIKDYKVGMEINHTCISHLLDEEGDKRERLIGNIERDIKASEPTHVMIHGPFTEIIPAAIDHRFRELGMLRVNQAYDVAAHFGLKKMVVHTGWMPFMYFKSYQAEKGAEFWQEFMSDKPSDFILAVENVLDDEPEMIKEMMEKVTDPRVRLCLDVGHAHAMTVPEYKVLDWIRILGPYITHFHLHNNDGTGDQHRALGDGTLGMKETLLAIEDCCPEDVTYTIEARKAIESLDWLGDNGFI